MNEIRMIVARATNGVIGKDGDLPWHLPADLKRFKALTMGGAMIMGRKTFESLPGVLPGRRHIVMTRDEEWGHDKAEVAHSIDEAIALAGDDDIWIIGGAEIFDMFAPRASVIELTEVLADVDGDTILADPRDSGDWRETACEMHFAEGDRPAFRFITLERVP